MDLTYLFTAPKTGFFPGGQLFSANQYTGTTEWLPTVGATFAAGTEYTATITLTPKTGYTLTGVAADFFKVDKATTVTNSANSGVVTAVFPATTVEITGYVAIPDVNGGTVASPTYATVDAVRAALPTTVTITGTTDTVPVTWTDASTYSTTAGTHEFTGTIGTLPAGYVDEVSPIATVTANVVIAASGTTATPVISGRLIQGGTTITGTCVDGATVMVSINDGTAAEATVTGTTWTITVATLASGETISVVATKAPDTASAVASTIVTTA